MLPFDDENLPLFTVGQVAQMLELQQAFLRRLDEFGVVRPSRSPGGQRRYSRTEVTVVRYVAQLADEGMTLAAIRRVLELEEQVKILQAEMRNSVGSAPRAESGPSGEPAQTERPAAGRIARIGPWVLAVAGVAGAAAAVALRPYDARAAAAQDWSPFVVVAGLLLIGLVADDDGLFAAAGHRLARLARSGSALFIGATVLIGIVIAVLNLDTSVAFLTPVLVYTARSRELGELALLYGCLLLSNAGSLLPGSNLTNLIVLGHLQLTGSGFLARMWLPAAAALAVTAVVVAFFERRSLRGATAEPVAPGRLVPGVGLATVILATVLVLTLQSPAIPVAAVGLAAAAIHLVRGRASVRGVTEVLGLPVLAGLFAVAVALGALGRAWAGPAELLSHLDSWGTAAVAGLATIVVNNLPAASLLAARTPSHPFSLIVGLNLGPNLCVTGSLAWLLWLRAAPAAGAEPSLRRASRIGVIAVPRSIAAALGALVLTSSL